MLRKISLLKKSPFYLEPSNFLEIILAFRSLQSKERRKNLNDDVIKQFDDTISINFDLKFPNLV